MESQTAGPMNATAQGLKAVPGDGGWPLLGTTLEVLRDPIGLSQRFHERFGPVFWTNQFGIRITVLMGPEGNEFALRNAGNLQLSGPAWQYYIGPFFNRGLMLLDGEEHRLHRGIMQAAFRKAALAAYVSRMNPDIGSGIAGWAGDRDFRALPRIKQLTLDLATTTFMGQQLGEEAGAVNRAFVDTVRAGSALLRFAVPGGRWKRGLDGRRLLEKFFRQHLPAHRASSSDDLFSQLCRAEDAQGARFSDDDVVNHMIFLLMAAHDTTTITLCSVLYRLAQNPEWQERLREEAQALGKPQFEHADLERTPLASLVMKEAMRLMPPVPGLPRELLADTEFMGYHLPRGSHIVIDIQCTHRMPEWWTDPERFDPERFAEPRNEHRRHPFQFVPFGGGAHTCIGMHFAELQVKAILHQLLLRYRWSVPTGYEMPVDRTALPVPKDGLPLKLSPL